MDFSDEIEKLRSDSVDKKVDAAISIATYNLNRKISSHQVNRLAPPLKRLLRIGKSEKKGTAAGALARLAYEHPSPIRDAEEDLIGLLRDDTFYMQHYFNASQASLALAAIENEDNADSIRQALDWYRRKGDQRAWATAKLAAKYLFSEGNAVDYEHIDFVCGEGPTQLVKHRTGKSPVNHMVTSLLLDDILTKNGQAEIRDVLSVNPEQVGSLQNVVNQLSLNIRDRQESGEYALDIFAHYAQEKPDMFIDLIDDAAVYLHTDIGFDTPENATKFLSQMAAVAPKRVDKHRDQIEELRQHGNRQIQENCNKILETLEESAINTSGQRQHNPSSSIERVNSDSERSFDALHEEAKIEGEEAVSQKTVRTYQTQQYNRSEKVKQYVKARADGQCEGCGDSAPFISKTGDPYLHAHHVHELSDGGDDTVDTVIALCPNCHYRVHHGEDGDEYNETLIRKLNDLEDGPVK